MSEEEKKDETPPEEPKQEVELQTYYDEEGNPIQTLAPEQVKEIQGKIEEAEKARAKNGEELSSLKNKLAKQEDKEFNFKRLKDYTDAERAKLSETELELKKQQEKLEEDQQKWAEQLETSWKDEALAVFGGTDVELRKKIGFHYDRIKDEARTKDEISKKMKDAYNLATGRAFVGPNPITQAASSTSSGNLAPSKKEKLSDAQKELGRKLGLSEEDMKNR